jgi:lysophospholipase L1-like esterase
MTWTPGKYYVAPRILAVGDSIVMGYNPLIGGWREPCRVALQALGRPVNFVGPNYNTGYHYGVDGQKAITLNSSPATFTALISTYVPDVLCLALGVNDMNSGQADAPTTLAALSSLIDLAQAAAPACRILVQTVITPTPTLHGPEFVTFAAGIAAMVSGQGATLVDVGAPALDDGLHPTTPGFATMAGIYTPLIYAATLT